MFLLVTLLVAPLAQAEQIGWITDIHAGKEKTHDKGNGNYIYPKKYGKTLEKVFDRLKSKGIMTVIASGDITNIGEVSYAKKVSKIAKKKGMTMLWAKGNHDGDSSMRALGLKKNATYYFVDKGDTRIIVMDSAQGTDAKKDSTRKVLGGFKQSQLAWFENAMQTDQSNIIVVTHHPIIRDEILLNRYDEFEAILKQSGKLKFVLSGHIHRQQEINKDGVNYLTLNALTRRGSEGSYAIIDLEDFSVAYEKL